MVVAFATMFNEPRTIGRLRGALDIPQQVKFQAKAVAASPILSIEATAEDPETAQRAAESMAAAFRDDVNAVRQVGTDTAIGKAQRHLEELLAQPGPEGMQNPLAAVVQTQINQMLSDSTNQLQDLQSRAGVTKMSPNIVLEFLMRAVGGLILGLLAALGVAALSTRIGNAVDLVDKTGTEPLVEVPAGGSVKRDRLREDRLRTLANIVSLQDLPKSTVVAVADCNGAAGARELGEALAGLSAQQGYRTVLVYADNVAAQHLDDVGFNDALANPRLVERLLAGGAVDCLTVVPSGTVVADRYSLLSREKIVAVLDELRAGADIIVMVAPSMADTVEAQPVCAAADLTILTVGRRTSRAGDVTSAVGALADAHAVLLGTVLMDGTKRT